MTERFDALLQVQEHDTTIDQLRHRRATLPEREVLARADASLRELERRTAPIRAAHADLAATQAALEQQIDAARTRRAELERKMFAGGIPARDLQAMDEEVRHLAARVAELEDREIEVMEALEPLDAELAAAEAERASLEHQAAIARDAIAAAAAVIDQQIADEREQRAAAASEVDAALLERYERLREKLGGTGAARLVGNSCGGCHLVLPAMELERIRQAPPDAVVTCEQCGRILVR